MIRYMPLIYVNIFTSSHIFFRQEGPVYYSRILTDLTTMVGPQPITEQASTISSASLSVYQHTLEQRTAPLSIYQPTVAQRPAPLSVYQATAAQWPVPRAVFQPAPAQWPASLPVYQHTLAPKPASLSVCRPALAQRSASLSIYQPTLAQKPASLSVYQQTSTISSAPLYAYHPTSPPKPVPLSVYHSLPAQGHAPLSVYQSNHEEFMKLHYKRGEELYDHIDPQFQVRLDQLEQAIRRLHTRYFPYDALPWRSSSLSTNCDTDNPPPKPPPSTPLTPPLSPSPNYHTPQNPSSIDKHNTERRASQDLVPQYLQNPEIANMYDAFQF